MAADPQQGRSVPNGMSPQNGNTGSTTFDAGPDEIAWDESPFDVSAAPKGRFVVETRAESTVVVSRGDAVRRGEVDQITAGGVASFSDAVAGEENTRIDGTLLERTGRGSRLAATRVETTVSGRLSTSATSWKGAGLAGGEDAIILGGALTDTWTGGLLIASGMSDDLVIGAGVRLTVPVDFWLNQLTGMEERPGTVAADGLMIDMCGTLFEREYGAGVHAAGIAVLSGTVFQTQRVGFRPMMKAAVGVRNLIPGSGGAAGEQPPPSPPPAGAGLATGAMVGTAVVGSAAGMVRHADGFNDATGIVGVVDELQEVSNLRHAEDSAATLDDASTAARNLDSVEVPNGMGAADPPPANTPTDNWVSPMSEIDLQRAQLPEGFDTEELLGRLDEMTATWLQQIEWGRSEHIAATNVEIGWRLDDLHGLGRHAGEFEVTPLPAKEGVPTAFHHAGLGDALPVRWPGAIADAGEPRLAQVEAELDALMMLRGALENGLDPLEELRSMTAHMSELYGATDPRTVAFADTTRYYETLMAVTRTGGYQSELDVMMLIRSELLAGRNPRVAAESFLESFEVGADTQRAEIVNFLMGSEFDVTARVPEGMDNSNLVRRWQGQAAELRRQAAAMDTSTPAGAERASTLSEAAGGLENAAFELMVGNDPTNVLLRSIGSIEARTFLDGGNGAFEAGGLRLAWQEYSVQLDLYRQAVMGESSLDVPGFRRTAASTNNPRGGAGVGGFGPVPDYPGLPEEFGGDELRVAINPPNYADEFPQGVPEEFRHVVGLQPESTDETATAVRHVELPQGNVPDEFRQMLDPPPAAVSDVATPATGQAATLPSGNPGLLDVYDGPPLAPIQPQLDDAGAAWRAGGNSAAAAEDVNVATRGNYQAMERATNAVPDTPVTISDDTRAAVRAMPIQAVPDDFKWTETLDALNHQYLQHRRSSNWRGALAYTDALEGMRGNLAAAFADFGGNLDDLPGREHGELRRAIQGLLEQANQAEDAAQARRISAFLESFDQNTYDLFADLAERADEFESGARGQIQPLDPHVDQGKLLDWLKSQQEDAMRRMGDAGEGSQLASHEATYYQQMIVAMESGLNPLTESGDQIAYLRATAPEQADTYSKFHDDLVGALSDPAFHRSAAEMGDDTYAPAAFLRPDLANQAPADDGMQTRLFDAEVADAEGQGAEVSAGDYPANRDRINENVGGDDFTRAPDEQPEGISQTEEPQGPRSNLRNPGADPGPIDLGDSRVINRGPDSDTASDLQMRIWADRINADANRRAGQTQGGIGQYMDASASLRTPQQRLEDAASRNPHAAARVEAANQMWDNMRVRDTRSPSEWDRMPNPRGYRSWDDSARGRRAVRFGDASVVTVYADADDVRRIRNQWRDLDNGNAALSWWTGSGINHPTDAIDAGEAVRHVPTPRTADSVPTHPSKWRASRQPGFGRLADSPGAFPFSTREQVIADLMQGQRVDASHIQALQGTLNDAVRAGQVRNKEWVRMSALLRSLRDGVVLGDSARPLAQAIDWRTLSKMLDMLESATTMI